MKHRKRISRRALTRGLIGIFACGITFDRSTSANVGVTPWSEHVSNTLSVLEAAANKLDLPRTNRTRSGSVAQLNESNAYLEGMPRLVDLIERASNNQGSELADRAAELLSELNLHEHVPPDMFAFPSISRGGSKPRLSSLVPRYRDAFQACKIRPEYTDVVLWYTQTITRNRTRYEGLSNRVAVPWYFIAIIHGLEASFNFRAHLHNGDSPLTKRTHHEPPNRPKDWLPPSDWEDSAIDALALEGFTNKTDWSLENMLYRWESFNGFGYLKKTVPSPYLWSFSNNYTKGKFTSDGTFDPSAISKQCGAAVMLKALLNEGVITI